MMRLSARSNDHFYIFFPFHHLHSISEGFLTGLCGKFTGLTYARGIQIDLGCCPIPTPAPRFRSQDGQFALLTKFAVNYLPVCALEKDFFKDLNQSAILATSLELLVSYAIESYHQHHPLNTGKYFHFLPVQLSHKTLPV